MNNTGAISAVQRYIKNGIKPKLIAYAPIDNPLKYLIINNIAEIPRPI